MTSQQTVKQIAFNTISNRNIAAMIRTYVKANPKGFHIMPDPIIVTPIPEGERPEPKCFVRFTGVVEMAVGDMLSSTNTDIMEEAGE